MVIFRQLRTFYTALCSSPLTKLPLNCLCSRIISPSPSRHVGKHETIYAEPAIYAFNSSPVDVYVYFLVIVQSETFSNHACISQKWQRNELKINECVEVLKLGKVFSGPRWGQRRWWTCASAHGEKQQLGCGAVFTCAAIAVRSSSGHSCCCKGGMFLYAP